MLFELLRALVVLTIAIPFAYIVFDVLYDISKRMVVFLRRQAVPVLAKVRPRDRYGKH